MQNKGKLFFNIIITITIIALLGIGIYIAYYYISNYLAVKEAEEAVDEFEKRVIVVAIEEENSNQEAQTTEIDGNYDDTEQTSTSRYTSSYRGYSMIGTMQIPKTKIKVPIVDKVTPSSIAAAVGVLYGPGPNEIGNTVYAAHNYRNGTFFSNNKNLVEGDKIYITDGDGIKLEYTIYNVYTTDANDFSYATRNTEGNREISLSTCTNDPAERLVIWAIET